MRIWNPNQAYHFHADTDADLGPTYHFDADQDPDPDPTFQFDAHRCGSGSIRKPSYAAYRF
jgi:hypothetical protein